MIYELTYIQIDRLLFQEKYHFRFYDLSILLISSSANYLLLDCWPAKAHPKSDYNKQVDLKWTRKVKVL